MIAGFRPAASATPVADDAVDARRAFALHQLDVESRPLHRRRRRRRQREYRTRRTPTRAGGVDRPE
jgi:hypothetical protein